MDSAPLVILCSALISLSIQHGAQTRRCHPRHILHLMGSQAFFAFCFFPHRIDTSAAALQSASESVSPISCLEGGWKTRRFGQAVIENPQRSPPDSAERRRQQRHGCGPHGNKNHRQRSARLNSSFFGGFYFFVKRTVAPSSLHLSTGPRHKSAERRLGVSILSGALLL